MARKNTPLLDTGDEFRRLEFQTVSGKALTLPGGLTAAYNVVLVNRGSWCPFCVAQLKSFQVGLPKLEEAGIGVVSFSVDSRETAEKMVNEHHLTFPIGYGANLDQVAETLGTFYDPAPKHTGPFLQSAGFLLGPGARVLVAAYSTGAIGRLGWQDVLGLVQYAKSAK